MSRPGADPLLEPPRLARLAYDLVAVPSETGSERALADLVERRCQELDGVALERLGNSVVVRVGADERAPALVGHLDTVPAWPGHDPKLDGLRVTGRGAADMKGGDAAILGVLDVAARDRLPVVVVLYDAEEGPHAQNGIHAVLRDSRLLGRPRVAFVCEPTGGALHAGCVGVLNADVVFRGRTAHSARPWEGENAILAAAPFLTAAARLERRPVEVEGLTFYDTLAVVQAAGGVARNVVPDRLTLGVNLRFAPGRDAAAVRAELEALAGDAAEVRWLDEAPPAPPGLDAAPLRAFVELTGVDVQPKQAWTDVATLYAAGIPAVNYGPGDASQAHQPGEWVDGVRIAEVAANLVRALRPAAA